MTTGRIVFSLVLILLNINMLLAQSTNIGTDYYRLGENGKAKEYFKKNFNSFPAEANFYLGEIAFSEGDFKQAEEYYKQNLSINPENSYGQIGLAKLELKSNQKSAEATLSAIVKKNKKDIDVVLTVGRAYLDNKMFDKAKDGLNRAKKISNKNPDVYILEGDIISAEGGTKKLGEAAGKYEMATYFAPDYPLGYIKYAKVYEHISAVSAIDKLKTIIEKQPDYIISYGFLGKLYTRNGFYPQAIDVFKTYFNTANYSVEDSELYARALYFTDDFVNARKIANEGLQKNPDHFVLNRYLMYIDAKTKNTEEGLAVAKKFFSLRDASGYISQDYTMYASILGTAERYDEAMAQFNKAIEMEPGKLEIYSEAASMAREMKDYALAASYQKKQMNKKEELSNDPEYIVDVVDVNTLGYDYYSAGATIARNLQVAEKLMKDQKVINNLTAFDKKANTDSLKNSVNYFTKSYSLFYLNKADSVFSILIEMIPDSYSGYRFKALTKHAINQDTEVGLAKPYYEKVVEILTAKEEDLNPSTTRALLEAYTYLGYHYYMKDDKVNTKLYWNKVLELDPNNNNAKLILEDISK